MRSLFLAALLALVLAAPAGAVFTDQEPANDAIATAPISFIKTGPVTTNGGKLALVAGDIDFLGIAHAVCGRRRHGVESRRWTIRRISKTPTRSWGCSTAPP